MFQHFGNRLKRDLKQIVDARLDASVAASGSHLRVSVMLPCGWCSSAHDAYSHPASKSMSSRTSVNGLYINFVSRMSN